MLGIRKAEDLSASKLSRVSVTQLWEIRTTLRDMGRRKTGSIQQVDRYFVDSGPKQS